MVDGIQKVAVLGSGVMGSGIAALIASAGVKVVLLDIVPNGAENRNVLTEGAIAKQLAGKPSGFVHPSKAALVICGNLEDNLDELKDCDWIVEAVLERLDVKQDVYRKIDAVRKKGSIVSSNTSTLPLHELTAGLAESFRADFMIAHFFNPPRFMRLLEVAASPHTSKESFARMCHFADVTLGKGNVLCKDTPGFIANRIGVYWLFLGLLEAIRLGVTVEQADAVMGRPVGIPKTGVFGLFDLIGIDLMPLIAKSLLDNLPASDAFPQMYALPDLVKKMIADGYTGRKGKGGFYRMNTVDGKKVKEAIDLKTGDFRAEEKKVSLDSLTASKKGLRELVSHSDIGGQYAWAVLSGTLHYAASLIPEIADDISAVDDAMRMGYNWKFGPFEIIDQLGADSVAARWKEEGKIVPAIVEKAAGKKLYEAQTQLTLGGAYKKIERPEGALMLADIKLTSKPLVQNPSASVWDMGDGIACLELTSKMNAIDMDILSIMEQVVGIVQSGFKGLVIGNDADNFSAGANLSYMLTAARAGEFEKVSELISRGHAAMMGLKYAPFPVVASLAGLALGGGCELALHSNVIQAHMEAYPGLVEVGVGLIPGWGGCKEMLLRHNGDSAAVFEIISNAKTAGSAEDARDMKILLPQDAISMNRARVLADAKQRCIALAKNYVAASEQSVNILGVSAKQKLLEKAAAASGHDKVIFEHLAQVLSGGGVDGVRSERELLALEHTAFTELIKTAATGERIDYMLNNGKPLKN
ncbi:MAG: 3-hydroxyacyl-CoA dehydrogenase/enoyl-CoA hydratase family protein [Alphaproteobacteria bacterium]|nr:3-hydroxyacyl-CoA dehydrogenase/enoyl-CoA hydratase family protein [Alphaproteobacteria bacterium]